MNEINTSLVEIKKKDTLIKHPQDQRVKELRFFTYVVYFTKQNEYKVIILKILIQHNVLIINKLLINDDTLTFLYGMNTLTFLYGRDACQGLMIYLSITDFKNAPLQSRRTQPAV